MNNQNAFNFLCYFHIIFWIFVCFGFLNRQTAEINLFYLIPIVYLIHILPYHAVTKLKEVLEPENTLDKIKDFEKDKIIVQKFYELRDSFKDSFGNPLSPQGMLILGAITSAWALKTNYFFI